MDLWTKIFEASKIFEALLQHWSLSPLIERSRWINFTIHSIVNLFYQLTLFVVGSKIYVKWRGGLFRPPLFSLRKWPFLVKKMIKPSSTTYLRTLQKVWNPRNLLSPLNNLLFEDTWNMLKFGNFQKVGFLGGQRGVMSFLTPQNDFTYQYLLFLGGWRPKNAVFQEFWILTNVIF